MYIKHESIYILFNGVWTVGMYILIKINVTTYTCASEILFPICLKSPSYYLGVRLIQKNTRLETALFLHTNARRVAVYFWSSTGLGNVYT